VSKSGYGPVWVKLSGDVGIIIDVLCLENNLHAFCSTFQLSHIPVLFDSFAFAGMVSMTCDYSAQHLVAIDYSYTDNHSALTSNKLPQHTQYCNIPNALFNHINLQQHTELGNTKFYFTHGSSLENVI
jgi:hypothetical protein